METLGFGPKLRRILGGLTACAFLWSGVLPGLAAPRAHAADASIAVVPLAPVLGSSSDKVADRVSGMLSAELSKSETLRLIPLSGGGGSGGASPQINDDDEGGGVTDVTVAAPSGGGGSAPIFQGAGDRALARGKGTISRAEKEMRKLKFDQAAQDFADGIAAVESSFDSLESFQTLTDAYLGLAIAQLRLGHRDEGQRALEAVVRLAPDMSLARSHFPAIFVRMFTQAHDRLIGSQGSLSVTSAVAGQSISLDGRDAGVTPATVKVLPGRHFVVLHSSAGQLAYRVDVPEGGEVQIGGSGSGPSRHVAVAPHRAAAPAPVASGHAPSSADLKTVREEIKANLIDGPGDVALRNIAKAAGAQFLVLGGLHVLNDAGDLALDLLVYAVGPDQLSPLKRHRFDGEMLGAQIEIYKAVQELSAKANPQGFPDALTLPAPVAADFNPGHKNASTPLAAGTPRKAPPSSADATPSTDNSDEEEDQIKLTTGQKPKAKPKGEGEARTDSTGARTLNAEGGDNPSVPPAAVEDTGDHKSGGLSTFTIVAISVLAVIAVGVGTYFIVDAATAKPSGWAPTANF